MNPDVYVRYPERDRNLSVKLNKQYVLSLMEDDDFIWYCETYNLNPSRLTSYFFESPSGRIISPRWILEYIRDQKKELFINYPQKTISYNNSVTAVKIFERIGIKVQKVNESLKEKTIEDLKRLVVQFRNERNWSQFHNPKDLAISLSLEASELLENFQWNTDEEALEHNFENIKEELADVLIYGMLMAEKLDIDLTEAIVKKIEKNREKYPIEKAMNSKRKYTEI
jgi:NTP pyrophosphatase (non-canonical NTP hydrolase)